MNYDANKAPLGRITKAQVKAGFLVLSAIEKKLLENNFDAEFESLVSKLCCCFEHPPIPFNSDEYYTKIPHNFGFQRPKLLKTMEEFKGELDLLEALSDVEVANSAMKKEEESDSVPMNPSDRRYEHLKCIFTVLDKKNTTYKMIETYMMNTQGATHGYNMKLHNVFEIDRHGESDGYNSHSKNIDNR